MFTLQSYLNHLSRVEGMVLVGADIPQLVGDAAGGAYSLVDIPVWVTEDPAVDAAVSYEITQFCGKGTVEDWAFVLWGDDW